MNYKAIYKYGIGAVAFLGFIALLSNAFASDAKRIQQLITKEEFKNSQTELSEGISYHSLEFKHENIHCYVEFQVIGDINLKSPVHDSPDGMQTGFAFFDFTIREAQFTDNYDNDFVVNYSEDTICDELGKYFSYKN